MPLDSKPLNFLYPGICLKGTKNPYFIMSGNKSQITVVACLNAAGWCILPMVIMDRKTMHLELAAVEVPGVHHFLAMVR